MEFIKIPDLVFQCAKKHPDPYLPGIAKLLIETAQHVNAIIQRLEPQATPRATIRFMGQTADDIAGLIAKSSRLKELRRFVTAWKGAIPSAADDLFAGDVRLFCDELLEKIGDPE